jgi:hypothetical protein
MEASGGAAVNLAGTWKLVAWRARTMWSISSATTAVHSMFKLRDQALVLLANPLPDHPGRHAGPTFEWSAP